MVGIASGRACTHNHMMMMVHMHDEGCRLWNRGFIYGFIILLLYCISSKSIDEGFVQSSLRSSGSNAVPHNNRQQKLDFLHGLVGLYNEQTRLFDFGKPLGTGVGKPTQGNKVEYSRRYNCTLALSPSFHKISESRTKCIKIARSKIVTTFAPIMASVGQRGFYMDPATHFNLGDQILVASSVYMLQYFKKRMTWCKGAQTFQMNMKQCDGQVLRSAAAKSGKFMNGKGNSTLH